MTDYDKNWENLFDRAESADPFDRLAALTRSTFFLEIALIAIGTVVPPQKMKGKKFPSLMQLLTSSRLVDEITITSIDDIKEAIFARNAAVHKGRVPSPHKCVEKVKVLYDAWDWMRREFVTQQTAANLAKKILMSDIFHNVFLFGSLSRDKWSPGDIDLLFFDNGEISYLGNNYAKERSVRNRKTLEKAGIPDTGTDKIFYAALDSDWIDIVVVHYKDFVNNPSYIRHIASTQDPYFLLNIADGIKKYDKSTDQWLDCDDLPFKKWKTIRNELVSEGILYDQ